MSLGATELVHCKRKSHRAVKSVNERQAKIRPLISVYFNFSPSPSPILFAPPLPFCVCVHECVRVASLSPSTSRSVATPLSSVSLRAPVCHHPAPFCLSFYAFHFFPHIPLCPPPPPPPPPFLSLSLVLKAAICLENKTNNNKKLSELNLVHNTDERRTYAATRLFLPVFTSSVTTRYVHWQRHNPPVPAYVHLAASQPACSCLCSLAASPPACSCLCSLARHNPHVPVYVLWQRHLSFRTLVCVRG